MRLVKQALSGWSRQLFAEIGKDIDGGRRRGWAKMQGHMNEVSGPAVKFESTSKTRKLEFDVTRCRFAEFFRALNEPELGALLVCSDRSRHRRDQRRRSHPGTPADHHAGRASCTFRYKFAPR